MGNHARDGKFDRPSEYLYHPYEFFFCGLSNSGKTTLVSKVVEKLNKDYEIGCVKHCSHSFDFDREGKDSWQFSHAGAESVLLNAPGRWAVHNQGELDRYDKSTVMTDYDFVLAEGAKGQKGDKMIVLDKDFTAMEMLKNDEITDAIALTGVEKPEETLGLPFFHRDDVDGISNFVLNTLKSKIPPIKALLLTGGKSTRMNQDKALLEYHGSPQINYMYDLIQEYCSEVYISCRNKEDYPGFEESAYLEDRLSGFGPLGGIISAISTDAKSAWLVAAVDLPYVTGEVFEKLISNRNPFKAATAFRSNFKDFPEPLLTIYEPHSRHRIFKFLGLGYSCPRKILINSSVEIIEQDNPKWLDNANTPEEYEAICADLRNESDS